MTTAILQAIVLMAAIVIVVRSEPALNRMSPCTPFMIRASFHLLTVGAVAEIVFILAGDVPSWPTAITSVGVAALLFCERRLRLLCPPTRRRLP
jgi:hypothetical protein